MQHLSFPLPINCGDMEISARLLSPPPSPKCHPECPLSRAGIQRRATHMEMGNEEEIRAQPRFSPTSVLAIPVL